MNTVRFTVGVSVENMFVLETISQSSLINGLFAIFFQSEDQIFRHKMVLRMPYGLKLYWQAVKDLHRHKDQILTDSAYWIFNPSFFGEDDELLQMYVNTPQTPFFVRYLYDVDDPDLCISSIDHHKYRYTLAICLEMFLRRQLAEYSDFFDSKKIHIRSHERYQNIDLILPQLYFSSNNPDDIRKLRVITKATIDHHEWWTCDEKLEKFRCRPALLNSMDCMQLLFESSEDVPLNLITKIAYHLRPFRFFLPLTFLLDIFGGWTADSIIEKNFPLQKKVSCGTFPDNFLLMDENERTSADNSLHHKLIFLDGEVRVQRRVTAFISGGFLSYALGLTSDYNGIDIFIEYNHEVYAWITQAYDSTVDCNVPRRARTLYGRNIWLRKSTHHPIFDSNHYMFNSSDENVHKPWDPRIIFRNHKNVLAKIDSIYELNRTHPIVQHWLSKYGSKNLPQIIFYRTSLKLHNYSILKIISGFDLPINRSALVLSHTNAFHLRADILNKLYGKETIEKYRPAITFVKMWKTDEAREILRIRRKVGRLAEEISPEIRGIKYFKDRETVFENEKKINSFLKYRRQMVLIRFHYDTIPNFSVDEDGTIKNDRVTKYISRITNNNSTDYEGNKALPLKVYPLKYLAYWQLMRTNSCTHNCLCYFDYSNNYKKFEHNEDEPKPSTST